MTGGLLLSVGNLLLLLGLGQDELEHGNGVTALALQCGRLLAWLPGCLTAWLPDCLAAWLPCCLAAWLPGCLAAWLPGCLALLPTCVAASEEWQPDCLPAWQPGPPIRRCPLSPARSGPRRRPWTGPRRCPRSRGGSASSSSAPQRREDVERDIGRDKDACSDASMKNRSCWRWPISTVACHTLSYAHYDVRHAEEGRKWIFGKQVPPGVGSSSNSSRWRTMPFREATRMRRSDSAQAISE